MKENSFRQAWTQNEDEILASLVKKYGVGNWVLISQKMDTKANTFGRTGKQCRQRWHNHLDPTIKKNQWTQQQQKIMFQSHKKYGNKWAQIASQLKGRTDNDIKNHFYSTLRKSLRRLSKMLGQKNSTQKIKQVKPSILSQLFDSPTYKKTKQTSEALFKFVLQRQNMNIKNLSKKDKQLLQNLIDEITSFSAQKCVDQSSQKPKLKRQSNSRLRSIQKKNYLLVGLMDQLQKNKTKNFDQKQVQLNQKFNNYQQRIPAKLRPRNSKLSQKQNNYWKSKDSVQQMQIQLPLTKITSAKKSSLFEGLPFNLIDDEVFQKNLFSYLDNDMLVKINSIRKQSSLQQSKLFNELIIPQNLSSKKSSSSGLSDMKKLISNNDKNSIYVTPHQPTPGYGQSLFKTWHFPPAIMTKQIIDQQTQNIKRLIQKNIKSVKNNN